MAIVGGTTLATIAAIEQPVVGRHRVALDVPLVKEQFVGPDLLAAESRCDGIPAALGWIFRIGQLGIAPPAE